MAGGMAGQGAQEAMRPVFAVLAALVLALCSGAQARAEESTHIAPMPKECEAPGQSEIASSPLPHVALALQKRKKIRILAIGGTSSSMRGPVSGGHFAVVEQFLESSYKGLDVEIIHRGVSGELAYDAGDRIKTEVALVSPDLVLWQLGTADALARVPITDFQISVTRILKWLKAHDVDVIMVGLRYARSMANDQQYQAMRTVVRSIARDLNVLRISRYEAEEVLDKIRKSRGVMLGDVAITESGYVCMAEYLARAIAAGLFVKEPLP